MLFRLFYKSSKTSVHNSYLRFQTSNNFLKDSTLLWYCLFLSLAMTNITAAFCSTLKSILSVGFLYGFCFAAMEVNFNIYFRGNFFTHRAYITHWACIIHWKYISHWAYIFHLTYFTHWTYVTNESKRAFATINLMKEHDNILSSYHFCFHRCRQTLKSSISYFQYTVAFLLLCHII